MIDIHKRYFLAPPAVRWDIFSAGLRRDRQGSGAFAHRAPHPPPCCYQHTTIFICLQYLLLHFYIFCPIIKSGFKLENY